MLACFCLSSSYSYEWLSFISCVCKQILIHLWQYCPVISIYLLGGLSHFKPLTACTLVYSTPPCPRLDGRKLDPVLLWCQMIVSDRIYRCYLTEVAQSHNYFQLMEGYIDRQTSHTMQSVFKQPRLETPWDSRLGLTVSLFPAVYFK